MNLVILMGRLTKDPDVHSSQSGTKWVTYTLAVDRRDGNADFIRCKAFGKAAEWCEKFLQKGMKISVEGRLQTGSYKDQEGRTVYTMDVVTSQHEFCEPKKGATSAPTGTDDNLPVQGGEGGFQPLTEGEDAYLPFK